MIEEVEKVSQELRIHLLLTWSTASVVSKIEEAFPQITHIKISQICKQAILYGQILYQIPGYHSCIVTPVNHLSVTPAFVQPRADPCAVFGFTPL